MEINVAEIFWFVWLTFPPVGLHLIDYLLIVLNLIFWIFWSREKKRNWNVETIFDCQLNTQPSCHPITIMQRAPNVMMMANWSCLYSDCSPSLSWWILRIGLLITDIKFVSIHPSIMWEYRPRTWRSHWSSIGAYFSMLCFFWINSSQKHWLDSCFV